MSTAGSLPRGAALLVGIVLAVRPASTHASQLPLPPSLYPAHTHITVIDPLSNAQMDCDWGFDCRNGQPVSTAPIFHLRTEDELHRQSGWAELGNTPTHGSRMLFAVYASRYGPDSTEGLPGNLMAFVDFRTVLTQDGYIDLDRYPDLLPRGVLGNSGVQLLQSRHQDVLAMTCWTGSIEAEGIVIYKHGSPTQRRLAMTRLARQIRAAVNQLSA